MTGPEAPIRRSTPSPRTPCAPTAASSGRSTDRRSGRSSPRWTSAPPRPSPGRCTRPSTPGTSATSRRRSATRWPVTFADWSASRYGWAVAPEQVTPLADVVAGLQAAIEHFTPPGSAVVLPTPAYMPFLTVPGLMGRELIQVPMVDDGGRATYDLDGIAQALARGAGLVVHVNPHNPLGRVFTPEEQLALADVVEGAGARVFADEIHAPLVYPGAVHRPYAALSEATAGHTVTATSASKAWNLPGLKAAQLVLSNAADVEHWAEVGLPLFAWRLDPGGAGQHRRLPRGRGLARRRPPVPRPQPPTAHRPARRTPPAGPVHAAGGHVSGLAGLPRAGPRAAARRLLPGARRGGPDRRAGVRGARGGARAAQPGDPRSRADGDRRTDGRGGLRGHRRPPRRPH